MTLALQQKSARRKASLALIGVAAISGALMAAIGLGVDQRVDAASDQFAVYTSIENVTPDSECPNGGGTGVNCNIYATKQQVYLNGGPSSDFLPDGYYCFSVYNPNTDTLLSSDASGQRSFQVTGGEIVYTGSHDVGTDARTADPEVTIQFFPFGDTTNPGGVYKFTLYQYASDQSGSTESECNQDDVVVQKTDNFKVGESVTETPTNTPVTPTNTPVTPTNTPVTPTNTPVTPTNTPVTPTSTPVTPTATPTGTLTPTATPTNTSTPTATPTGTLTPTETPTNPPTNTPTNTPTQPSTVSPEQPTAVPTTPVSEVLGEKTPGAPSAGTGIAGESGGINMLLVVLGLIAISAGLGAVTLATTGRDDD